MTQIENEITRLSVRLEDATHEYARVSDRAAQTEADYRYQKSLALIRLVEGGSVRTAQEREARADAQVDDERRAHLATKYEREAVRESLHAIRTRIEALRTLAATVRVQT